MVVFVMMALEGPIVTLASSFLSSLGIHSPMTILIMSVVADLVGDSVFYALGYFGGRSFIHTWGRKFGITEKKVEVFEKFFDTNGAKAILLAKSTTGLCFITFVLAGAARMRLRVYFLYAFIGGVIWSSILVFIGYFFGYMYQEIAKYISWAGYLIFISFVVVIVVMWYCKKQQKNRLLTTKRNI